MIMDVFLNNFYFIWFNSFLALISVLFGWLMSKANSIFAKAWTGLVWLIFLPNTLYILTDISHLFEDWPKINNLFRLILIIQYALFSIAGVLAFIISVYFFQRMIERKSAGWKKKKIRLSTLISISALNFLVGFGVVLGGIQRTNSWHVLTDPSRVLEDSLDLLYSQELLMLSLGVGLFANALYFIMAETVAKWVSKTSLRDKKFSKKWTLEDSNL